MSNILSTLRAGSGLDTRALVDGLVGAERTARTQPLTRRAEALGARITALGQLRAGLQGISDSLGSRVRGGTLGLAPVSSDAGLGVQRLGQGPAASFRAAIGVTRLAAPQRLGLTLAGPDAPVGQGVLTIIPGRRTPESGGGFSFSAAGAGFNVTVSAGNDSLAGLRDAINAAGGPVRASIVANAGAATLVLRGADGSDGAFVISAAPADPGGPLARFNHAPGDARWQELALAGDAELTVDGVAVRRPSNSIDDLLPGTRLVLGRPVAAAEVTAQRAPAELATAVGDLASALGAMRGLVADLRRGRSSGEEAGVLASVPAARDVDQQIVAMIGTPVAAANGMRLSDLGVAVTREGGVTFDAVRLAALPPERQADAEALLRHLSGPASPSAPGRLTSIAARIGPAADGLARQRDALGADQARAEARLDAYRTLLARQFAAMDNLVSSSRAVETQLDQLVALWTRRES